MTAEVQNSSNAEKAWAVWPVEDYGEDNCMEIVFAPTRGKAIYLSEIYTDFCDREWTAVRAKRAPEFDGKQLNSRTYIENGWWVSCEGCGSRNLGETEIDDGEAFYIGDWLYCDACYAKKKGLWDREQWRRLE